MNKKIIADVADAREVVAIKTYNEICSAYDVGLTETAKLIIEKKLPSLEESVKYLIDMYHDKNVNPENFSQPEMSEILVNGKVILSQERRLEIIDLFSNIQDVYCNDEHKLSQHENIAFQILSVLKLSAFAAANEIYERIKSGSIDPWSKIKKIINFAGTANPLHWAHLVSMLQSVAYSIEANRIDVVAHIYDFRKIDPENPNDMAAFINRYYVAKETLKPFGSIYGFNDLDTKIYNRLCELADQGLEVINYVLDPSGYFATDIVVKDRNGNTSQLPTTEANEVLRYAPADGESKLAYMVAQFEAGVPAYLAHFAGDDHYNICDTHKNLLRLMMDSIGKVAFIVKRSKTELNSVFNSGIHQVAALFNVRNKKNIDNIKLLRQFGYFVLGLEEALMDPKKIKKAYSANNSHGLTVLEKQRIEDRRGFIERNMDLLTFRLKDSYILSMLNDINEDEIAERAVLRNVDDSTDILQFTINDFIDSSGVDIQDVKDQIINIKGELITALNVSRDEFDKLIPVKAREIMQVILDIENTSSHEIVIKAICNALGIELTTNFATVQHSSTFGRNFFKGIPTEPWAALFIPVSTLKIIFNDLLSKSGDAPYDQLARETYDINKGINEQGSAIAKIAEKLGIRIN